MECVNKMNSGTIYEFSLHFPTRFKFHDCICYSLELMPRPKSLICMVFYYAAVWSYCLCRVYECRCMVAQSKCMLFFCFSLKVEVNMKWTILWVWQLGSGSDGGCLLHFQYTVVYWTEIIDWILCGTNLFFFNTQNYKLLIQLSNIHVPMRTNVCIRFPLVRWILDQKQWHKNHETVGFWTRLSLMASALPIHPNQHW